MFGCSVTPNLKADEIVDELTAYLEYATSVEGLSRSLSNAYSEDGGIIYPFQGEHSISSEWHVVRNIPSLGIYNQLHRGIDYSMPVGTMIRAVKSGRVIFAGYHHKIVDGNAEKGYGYMVLIYHGINRSGNAIYTQYCHLKAGEIKVSTGQWVGQYWNIAESGNTGDSTGPHLHYTIIECPSNVIPYGFYSAEHSGLKSHSHIWVDRTYDANPESYDWSNF